MGKKARTEDALTSYRRKEREKEKKKNRQLKHRSRDEALLKSNPSQLKQEIKVLKNQLSAGKLSSKGKIRMQEMEETWLRNIPKDTKLQYKQNLMQARNQQMEIQKQQIIESEKNKIEEKSTSSENSTSTTSTSSEDTSSDSAEETESDEETESQKNKGLVTAKPVQKSIPGFAPPKIPDGMPRHKEVARPSNFSNSSPYQNMVPMPPPFYPPNNMMFLPYPPPPPPMKSCNENFSYPKKSHFSPIMPINPEHINELKPPDAHFSINEGKIDAHEYNIKNFNQANDDDQLDPDVAKRLAALKAAKPEQSNKGIIYPPYRAAEEIIPNDPDLSTEAFLPPQLRRGHQLNSAIKKANIGLAKAISSIEKPKLPINVIKPGLRDLISFNQAMLNRETESVESPNHKKPAEQNPKAVLEDEYMKFMDMIDAEEVEFDDKA